MTTTNASDERFEDKLLDELLAVHAEMRHDAITGPTVRRGRHRHVGRVAVAVAAVAVGVAVIAQVLPGGIDKPNPAAAAELKRLAARASTLPAVPAPRSGQFQYTDSIGTNTSTWVSKHTFTVDVRTHRQIWIGQDGSGRIVETSTDPTFPTEQDRANWVASGSPAVTPGRSDEAYGPGGLSDGPVDLWSLPTDSATLASLISSRQIEGGPPGAQEDFVQVGDLLRETDAPPALRAALFRVASAIPGVRLLGTTRTPAGASGTALAYVEQGQSGTETLHELLFDPATSALIGTQDVVVNPATHSSSVGTWTAYLTSMLVDSTRSTS